MNWTDALALSAMAGLAEAAAFDGLLLFWSALGLAAILLTASLRKRSFGICGTAVGVLAGCGFLFSPWWIWLPPPVSDPEDLDHSYWAVRFVPPAAFWHLGLLAAAVALVLIRKMKEERLLFLGSNNRLLSSIRRNYKREPPPSEI